MVLELQQCRICGKHKSLDQFYKKISNKSGIDTRCNDCTKIAVIKIRREGYRIISKVRALRIYGGKCKNCGNGDTLILQFHHTKGNKDRENSEAVWFKIIKEEKMIDEYELLCGSCHILADIRDGTKKGSDFSLKVKEVYNTGHPNPKWRLEPI